MSEYNSDKIDIHITPTVIKHKNGNKLRVLTYPPSEIIKKVDDDKIIDNLYVAVFNSMFFTSKRVGICELSGEQIPTGHFAQIKLIGAVDIKNNSCAGDILCHKKYLDKFEPIANLIFENENNVIQNHSWKDVNLNIQRSNGKITPATITGCIKIDKNDIMFYVKFMVLGEIQYKWVPLDDYNNNDISLKGLLTLNKQLKDKEIIFYEKEHPIYMNAEREEWKDKIKKVFTKTGIKYTFSFN